MKKFLALLCLSLAGIMALSRCDNNADTYSNRQELAFELLKNDCHGVGNAVIAYMKEVGKMDSSSTWGKVGEVAARFAIHHECKCLCEAVSKKIANQYTLAQLKSYEGKSVSEMDKLPTAVIESYAEIISCVKF